MIKANIIADSISEYNFRITTFVLTFPRIILSEFNTHRMLSRNSASSRAIPLRKALYLVWKNPFIPIAWMKDHKGMQGNKYFNIKAKIFILKQLWLTARNFAIIFAWLLNKIGLTKQICNRLLEPFMWHTAIVTATEWENFFALRAHPDAEIHIADLANKMLDAYNESTPKLLKVGEWHIPFGDKIDLEKYILSDKESLVDYMRPISDEYNYGIPMKVKIATARCARVSYLNFEGKDDYRADITLHNRLAAQGHWSPFEHCAQAMSEDEVYYGDGLNGNFKGWVQYRKTFENENKRDKRVTEKHDADK